MLNLLKINWVKLGRLLAILPILPLLIASNLKGEEGGSSLTFKHEYFWDANGVWNQTPTFSLNLALSRKWTFHWEQEVDIVTGASRRLGAKYVGQSGDRSTDAVSGASKIETRFSESPSITYSHKGNTASASFYYSRENDYFSMAPAGSVSMDFFERNTTIGLNYAEFFDHYKPQGYYATQGGKKSIRSIGATLAQSITAFTLIGLTGSYISSSGYLGHPYNPPIDVNGKIMIESVPDKKGAAAVAGQIVQGWLLGDRLGSINIDARRFQDSWDIKSSTADVKISQYFTEGGYFRVRGRYYNQTGAYFSKKVYDGGEEFRTADIRFYPFTSYLVGAKLSMACPESWGESAMLPDRWDIKYDYTHRNTKGDQVGTTPGVPSQIRYQLYEPDEFYTQGVFMFGLVFNL